jgi:hypothetical protein
MVMAFLPPLANALPVSGGRRFHIRLAAIQRTEANLAACHDLGRLTEYWTADG